MGNGLRQNEDQNQPMQKPKIQRTTRMKQIFLYTSLAAMALAVTTTGAAPERCDGTVQLTSQSNLDRKSTRLNSSHVSISYAVFCLIPHTPRSPLFPYTTLFRSKRSASERRPKPTNAKTKNTKDNTYETNIPIYIACCNGTRCDDDWRGARALRRDGPAHQPIEL